MTTTVSPCYSCGPHPGCSDGCQIIEAWKATGKRDKAFVILMKFYAELKRAESLHKPMTSVHHGAHVIWKEFQELSDAIAANKDDQMDEDIRKEATHVGAMALRFLKDLGGDHELP